MSERPAWWSEEWAPTDDERLIAIRDMEAFRRSHAVWADHFEQHPEIEAAMVATGQWDSATEHRQIVAAYDRVLRLLRLPIDTTAPRGAEETNEHE